jgi:hypothetical protein
MKTILLIVTIICFKSYSQNLEFKNFKLEEGKLLWQKVYETELSHDEILKSFKTSGIVKNTETFKNSVTGTIENLDLDFKGFGKTEMNTAMYISRSYFKSFVLIELKEGRYRITLKEMKLIQKYSVGTPGDLFSSETGDISELKTFAVKNNNTDFRNSFKKAPSGILNFTFDKVFGIKKKKKSDW